MKHRRYRVVWPNYTLPAVAKLAMEAQGTPPALVLGTNMPNMPFERVVMNGYGSYYQSTPNYYRNPVPYVRGDVGAPVPGWGTSVRVAGPQRVGIGETTMPKMVLAKAALLRRVQAPDADVADTPPPADEPPQDVIVPPEASEVMGLPWYVFPIAAAVVLGGVGYYGTKKGWF